MDGSIELISRSVYEPADPIHGFKIGHNLDSQTRFIKSIECENKKIIIIDTPGFEDTESVEINIANSLRIT